MSIHLLGKVHSILKTSKSNHTEEPVSHEMTPAYALCHYMQIVLRGKGLIFAYQQQWLVPSSALWWLDTGTHQECLNTLNHFSAPPPSSGVYCAGLLTLQPHTHTRTHKSKRIRKCARRENGPIKTLCVLIKIETTRASSGTSWTDPNTNIYNNINVKVSSTCYSPAFSTFHSWMANVSVGESEHGGSRPRLPTVCPIRS